MSVTRLVSKLRGPLKAVAHKNILCMVVTLAVSQPARSGFPAQFSNKLLIEVTLDTFQELMGPYWVSIDA